MSKREDSSIHEHFYAASFMNPSDAIYIVEVSDIDAKKLKESTPDEILDKAVKNIKETEKNSVVKRTVAPLS